MLSEREKGEPPRPAKVGGSPGLTTPVPPRQVVRDPVVQAPCSHVQEGRGVMGRDEKSSIGMSTAASRAMLALLRNNPG